MRTLINAIYNAQPLSKLANDAVLTKVVYRRAGVVLAALTWRYLKISPNMLSLLAGGCALVAMAVSYFGGRIWLAAIMLLASAVIDCADGALARYLKINDPKGELADAIGGYVITATLPYTTWLVFCGSGGALSSECLALGVTSGVASTVHFVGRSMHLKNRLSTSVHGNNNKKIERTSLGKRVGAELSFTGFMFPIILAAWCFNVPILAWYYVIGYSFTIGAGGVVSSVRATLA